MNKTAQAASVFRKTADTFAAGAKTLPQQYFVSEKSFKEEQTKLFARERVLVGHQSQIANAGKYFTAHVASESVIVVRDQRSSIRGFYNVGRHRGPRLARDSS